MPIFEKIKPVARVLSAKIRQSFHHAQLLPENYLKNYRYFLAFISSWYSKQNLWIGMVMASLTINLLSLAFPILLLQIYDRVIANHAVVTLVLLCMGVFAAMLLETILAGLRGAVVAWCGMRYEYFNQLKAYQTIIDLPLTRINQQSTGKFLDKFTAINQLKNFYGGKALINFCDLPFVLIYILFIFYLANYLVLVPIILITIQALTTFFIGRNMSYLETVKKTVANRRSDFLINLLSGIATVKTFNMEAMMLRRYERLQDKLSCSHLNYSVLQTTLMIISTNAAQLSLILITVFGSIGVLHNQLTLGALTACMILAGRANAIVSQMVEQSSRFRQIKVASLEYNKLLLLAPSKKEDMATKETNIYGELRLDSVCYQDKKTQRLLLQGIHFKVSPGEMACIQGNNFSGKTLLLEVMRGLLTPGSGKINIDGKPFEAFEETVLETQLVYLASNPTLFEGTLLENLSLFDPHYTVAAKELCNRLHLEHFIDQLPRGYDTEINMNLGGFLPAGIKQLINLVRALVRDPQIILLDDVNTAFDFYSETAFRDLLLELKKTKTLVVVTHRPSICALANTHYTMAEGRLSATPHGGQHANA